MPLPAYTIFGFDLSELSWSKFGPARLWESGWRWRRGRVVLYQLTSLLLLASEICATVSLAQYSHLQTDISRNFSPAYLNQNSLVSSQIALIVPSVWAMVVLGTEFFFLAQYPGRRWPEWWKKGMLVMITGVTIAQMAAQIAGTVIVFTETASLSRIPPSISAEEILDRYSSPPLQYSSYGLNIGYIVLSWVTWPLVVASTILMYIAQRSDRIQGPERIVPPPAPPARSASSASASDSAQIRGVFFWAHEDDSHDARELDPELEGTPLSVDRSSEETAVGSGEGVLGAGNGGRKRDKKGLLGAMMPGLERD